MMKHGKYIVIILVAFFIGVCTNLAHPVTPYLVKESGWPEISFSIFFAVMSLGMLIFAPVWGNFGDKHGKRIVILLCALGYSAGQVMFGFFSNLYAVIFARFFAGCFSCGLNVAIVSYLATSKGLAKYDKTRLIPTVLSFQLVGNAIGNFLGGKLGVWFGGNGEAYRRVLFFQAGLLSIIGILIYFFFGMKDEELNRDKGKRKNFFQNLAHVRKIGVWSVIFLLCLTGFSLVFTNVQKYLDYYYSDIGKTSGELGSLNLVIGFVTLFANTLITPILLKKLNPIVSCIVSAVLGSIAIIVTFAVQKEYLLYMVYSVYMIYIISKAVIESASVSYIAKNKKIAPGLIMGVRQSFISLGAVIGPLLGGAIYYAYPIEKRTILFYSMSGIYLFSAIVLLVIYLTRRKFKSNPEGEIVCESVDQSI